MNSYAWADTAYDLSWTLAVIQGRTEDEVRAGYGADQEVSKLTFEQANAERTEHLDDYGLVQFKAVDDYIVVIEPNGWVGNAPEVARKLSSPTGLFFSVYWSPSGHQILQATGGQITGRFDPTFIGLPAGANDMLPGWVGDDEFDLEHLRSASLAAVERQTGLAFDPAWLTDPLPTYRVSA
ncbi:DUF6461 domain-containing protein [Actinokineospora xionganensis]|uniref:Uncharacterized protein n=1 Tax=Actinokineospora xionganensis TaxID=2684470 RepID=A0ABR7LE60_9PSEU|nr:DUF6461 domain-containing protein [Actinokineospora xionganensis]MBC6451003.1 hypothetical protein [Actinokineospora xionganensis]